MNAKGRTFLRAAIVGATLVATSITQGCIVSEDLGARPDGGVDGTDGGTSTSGDGGESDGGTSTLPAATRLVLFGGVGVADGHGNPPLDDTWTFDGTGWSQVNALGPSARNNMCFARYAGGVVLFGGSDDTTNAFLDDTWTFDGSSWTKLDIVGPSARAAGHQCATRGGSVVLFGGSGPTDGGTGDGDLDDTWVFDGHAWTEVAANGPSARAAAAMAPLGNRVVLYGGDVDEGAAGDTWIFDGAAWTKFAGTSPEPRIASTMTTLGNGVVLFGGRASATFTETWAFDGFQWQNENATPPDPNNYLGITAELAGNLFLQLDFQSGTWKYDPAHGWSPLSFAAHPVLPSARGGEGLAGLP